jgi:hypothetical protein
MKQYWNNRTDCIINLVFIKRSCNKEDIIGSILRLNKHHVNQEK